jgi:hypothetical protein
MESRRRQLNLRGRGIGIALATAILAPVILVGFSTTAQAASSKGCENGAFSLVNLTTGAVVAKGPAKTAATIPAGQLGDRFAVRGRYAQFEVTSKDFAVYNQAFTGAANELDMTGGRFTPVFASKVPDLKGATLTSSVTVELEKENLAIQRTGTGVSMKIQAKDCAQGGIFQMEPARSDNTATVVTHTLATSATPGLTPFYFDNPNFRARIGQFLGSTCTSVQTGPPGQFCVQVSARVNIANDLSSKFVARDSTQVATRLTQTGRVTSYSVASGGRMGFVTGEDAVEVANPPTNCVSNCQAQNQVRGRLVTLGFPFPVPVASRL